MIDQKTDFELNLLARLFQMVLLRVEARSPYWVSICEALHRYRSGAGIPVSWYAGKADADKMAFSRLLGELAEEGRIVSNGRTRAQVCRLSEKREAELLGLTFCPDMSAVYSVMKAISAIRTKGIGDGFHLLFDAADQESDRKTGSEHSTTVQYAIAPAVWHGWIDWLPSIQTGYIFVKITPKGRKLIKAPCALPGLEPDQVAADVFYQASDEARDGWKGLSNTSSQNIGDIPIPYSFGNVPRRTVARMIDPRTLPR